MGKAETVVKYLHTGVFLVIDGGFSSLSNGEKGVPVCVFKRRFSFQYVLNFVSLFLSCRITLKAIFNHFHNYLFKVYKCINQHIEKPVSALFKQYRIAPLFLHLKQWCITNQTESLMVVQYATKPKNPV